MVYSVVSEEKIYTQKNMKEYDAIIIGTGQFGVSCAYKLAGNGWYIADKLKFIRFLKDSIVCVVTSYECVD